MSTFSIYRAYILSEIYKTFDEITNLKIAARKSISSKSISKINIKLSELTEKLQQLNKILWSLEALTKIKITNDSEGELEELFRELKSKKLSNHRLMDYAFEIVKIALLEIEKAQDISHDEIVNAPHIEYAQAV